VSSKREGDPGPGLQPTGSRDGNKSMMRRRRKTASRVGDRASGDLHCEASITTKRNYGDISRQQNYQLFVPSRPAVISIESTKIATPKSHMLRELLDKNAREQVVAEQPKEQPDDENRVASCLSISNKSIQKVNLE